MGYKDPTYVVFDGDKDKWAYAFMLGWKSKDHIDFDFRDAHDIGTMTGLAQSEAYVKKNLRDRMERSSAVIALIGDSTKNLYKYVRWELELALDLGLPIIVVNLNDLRSIDDKLCPAILKGADAMHVPFKMKIIKYALDNWPGYFKSLTAKQRGDNWHYKAETYTSLSL
jgi:MTH538 TIR-like domain (DUF1863)